MRQRPAVLISLLALACVLALACSDGDGGANGGETPNDTPSNGTAPLVDGTGTADPVPTFPGDPAEPTPRNLGEARERLTDQLDAIGANIGAVPDDIRQQLLERCEALAEFADRDDVESICQAIAAAIDTNDPGLIDRVLGQLADLEG
jgi:hypothetical protein